MILLIKFFPPLLRWDLRTPPKSSTHSTFDTHEGSPALSIPYSGCFHREPEHHEADTPLNDQTAELCEQIASHHAYWLLRTSTMRHIWCSSRLQRLILITRYITDASSKKSPTPYILYLLNAPTTSSPGHAANSALRVEIFEEAANHAPKSLQEYTLRLRCLLFQKQIQKNRSVILLASSSCQYFVRKVTKTCFTTPSVSITHLYIIQLRISATT